MKNYIFLMNLLFVIKKLEMNVKYIGLSDLRIIHHNLFSVMRCTSSVLTDTLLYIIHF